MKIALDVDGVLADVTKSWIRTSKSIRCSIAKHDITSWDFWKNLGIPQDVFHTELDNCWSNWNDIEPTERDLGDKTSRLSDLGDVDIVTARHPDTDPFVKMWLKQHNIVYRNYVSVAAGVMKADLDYDIFIDDSPITAIQMIKQNKKMILYTQPWNMHVDGLPRINSLLDVPDILDVI